MAAAEAMELSTAVPLSATANDQSATTARERIEAGVFMVQRAHTKKPTAKYATVHSTSRPMAALPTRFSAGLGV